MALHFGHAKDRIHNNIIQVNLLDEPKVTQYRTSGRPNTLNMMGQLYRFGSQTGAISANAVTTTTTKWNPSYTP